MWHIIRSTHGTQCIRKEQKQQIQLTKRETGFVVIKVKGRFIYI